MNGFLVKKESQKEGDQVSNQTKMNNQALNIKVETITTLYTKDSS
jgi:hypothetical protein